MKSYDIEEGEKYLNTYNNKICTVIYKFWDGDCKIKYKNGKEDLFHYTWLEPIKNTF